MFCEKRLNLNCDNKVCLCALVWIYDSSSTIYINVLIIYMLDNVSWTHCGRAGMIVGRGGMAGRLPLGLGTIGLQRNIFTLVAS